MDRFKLAFLEIQLQGNNIHIPSSVNILLFFKQSSLCFWIYLSYEKCIKMRFILKRVKIWVYSFEIILVLYDSPRDIWPNIQSKGHLLNKIIILNDLSSVLSMLHAGFKRVTWQFG